MRLSNERLAEIKARAEAATPGPWFWDEYQVYLMAGNAFVACEDVMGEGGLMIRGVGQKLPIDKNADFIAHARQDIPDLIAEIERLKRELQSRQEVKP